MVLGIFTKLCNNHHNLSIKHVQSLFLNGLEFTAFSAYWSDRLRSRTENLNYFSHSLIALPHSEVQPVLRTALACLVGMKALGNAHRHFSRFTKFLFTVYSQGSGNYVTVVVASKHGLLVPQVLSPYSTVKALLSLLIQEQIFLEAAMYQAVETQGSGDSGMNKTGKVQLLHHLSLVGGDK